ncbi:hypothetical protein AMECASPLE_037214, partial [Ameca splendens]
KPSTSSNTTITPPPPFQSLPCVFPSLVCVIVVVLLVILVLLVRRHVQRKSEGNQQVGWENINYTDINISHHRRQKNKSNEERDPAVVYSAVRREDVSYGEIAIRNKGNKAKTKGRTALLQLLPHIFLSVGRSHCRCMLLYRRTWYC